ncbi:restriction endonuclease [Ruegeria sp.]|uniref:restriction endonuclease n=1 Tax=Ruegeria sp. TaxID=1879320 RepID=UPI002319AB82|nr:restriction endonuclease [Ruegeria sp.]MDA7963808.1 restriction endonuclease [Ruegeria sp.]
MDRSRYDELHDRFDPIQTGKAGTRYERLAAKVLKSLHEQDAVVHDIRVIGNSDVKHQIDVTINKDGQNHRILVECKDFDIRGAKVGLDVVRSFRSVLEDTGADSGLILTCNGFTRDAKKYAKSKGIKLALLREFTKKDHEGRIQKIVLQMNLRFLSAVSVEEIEFDPQNRSAFFHQLQTTGLNPKITKECPIYFVKGKDKIQFVDFLSGVAERNSIDQPLGRHSVRHLPDGWRISILDGSPIDFRYVDLEYVISGDTMINEITSNRIAELILDDFSGSDLVIYEDQLTHCQIDEQGNVVKKLGE